MLFFRIVCLLNINQSFLDKLTFSSFFGGWQEINVKIKQMQLRYTYTALFVHPLANTVLLQHVHILEHLTDDGVCMVCGGTTEREHTCAVNILHMCYIIYYLEMFKKRKQTSTNILVKLLNKSEQSCFSPLYNSGSMAGLIYTFTDPRDL